MAFPSTTASLAAAFAILMVLLSIQTSLRRAQLNVTHGDAGLHAVGMLYTSGAAVMIRRLMHAA